MEYSTALRNTLLNEDFPTFLEFVMSVVSPGDTLKDNWHLQAIAYQLQRLEDDEIHRLLVTLPPRHLKTTIISIAWVCWRLGRDPKLRFVCISYAIELAYEISRSARKVMEHPTFKAAFPACRLKRAAEDKLETTAGGYRFATSIGGALTGFGGDIFVIDDPIKAEDAFSQAARDKVESFYNSTLVSRPNDKERAKFVVIMQRLHAQDLAGILIKKGEYEHLNLPAIAQEDECILIGPREIHQRKIGDPIDPARESLASLQRTERSMGPFTFSAQYLQNPRPAGGVMVKPEWLRYYAGTLVPAVGDLVVQSWDCAINDGVKNDWSVCLTAILRGNDTHVIDRLRERLVFPDLEQRVVAQALRFNAKTVLIEEAASGQQLLQVFQRKFIPGFPTPIGIRPNGDKVTRLARASGPIQAGNLYLPKDAPWVEELVNEILTFPTDPYDDQVDALSQLINWRAERPVFLNIDPYYGQKDWGKGGSSRLGKEDLEYQDLDPEFNDGRGFSF